MSNQLKAISLWQPWAWMVDKEYKLFETRSWYTKYRGPLVICSTLKNTKQQKQTYLDFIAKYNLDGAPSWESLRFGEALCLVDLTKCVEMSEVDCLQISELERDCGDWKPGRFAWRVAYIKTITNVPIKGQQGLFNLDKETSERILCQ